MLNNLSNPFEEEVQGSLRKVHIFMRARKRNQTVTTIHHLDDDLDIAKIAKAMRKRFNCSATVKLDENHNNEEVIKLSGDHRLHALKFLVESQIYHEDQIVLH